MARTKKPSGKAKAKARANKLPAAPAVAMSRRAFLKNGMIGGAVLGGVGFWTISGIRSVAAEQDLSRLGKGLPAVVQIHDPHL